MLVQNFISNFEVLKQNYANQMRRSRKHQVMSNYKDVEITSARAFNSASILSSYKSQESNNSFVSFSNICSWKWRYYPERDSNQEIYFTEDKHSVLLWLTQAYPCR